MRAGTVCSYVDSKGSCPHLKPCPIPEHSKKHYSKEHNQRSNERYGSSEYRRNRKRALERDGHRCCFVENGKRCEARDKLTAHHIRPVRDDGSHELANLVTLCNPHNQRVDAELRKRRTQAS